MRLTADERSRFERDGYFSADEVRDGMPASALFTSTEPIGRAA